MSCWADKLAAWEAGREGGSAKRANSAASSSGSASIVPNGSNGTIGSGLPPVVAMGLHRLRGGAPRQIINPVVWREVVQDALRLRDEGWAAAALSLGWSLVDLWGHSPDRDGLAVWLRGRPLVLVDDRTAVVRHAADRAQFTRCRNGMPGSVLLWDMI